MKNATSHFNEIDWVGKLADLKQSHYENTLLVHAMLDLLIEKGLLTQEEILEQVNKLNK